MEKALEKQPHSLQKFTNTEPIQTEVEEFIVDILYGEKWEPDKYKQMAPEQKAAFRQVFQIALNALAHDDRDRFIEMIDPIMGNETRRQLWDMNHVRVLAAINRLTQQYSRFPTRTELSTETGLSRQTINKHLKEYFASPQYQEKQEEFIMMREKVLARVYHYAVNGDTKAAKLFLEATANQQPKCIRNQQNNLIQINGLTITQEQLNALPEPQQAVFQELINTLGAIKR